MIELYAAPQMIRSVAQFYAGNWHMSLHAAAGDRPPVCGCFLQEPRPAVQAAPRFGEYIPRRFLRHLPPFSQDFLISCSRFFPCATRLPPASTPPEGPPPLAFRALRSLQIRPFATSTPVFCYQTFCSHPETPVFPMLSASLFFPARGLVLA